LRGIIERLGTEKAPRQLVIRHESASDMESMAMPFFIDKDLPLNGFEVGDKVAFQFEIVRNSGAEHVTKLEKLPADTVLKIPGAAATSTTPANGAMKGMPGM
jgi:hypothetical protein